MQYSSSETPYKRPRLPSASSRPLPALPRRSTTPPSRASSAPPVPTPERSPSPAPGVDTPPRPTRGRPPTPVDVRDAARGVAPSQLLDAALVALSNLALAAPTEAGVPMRGLEAPPRRRLTCPVPQLTRRPCASLPPLPLPRTDDASVVPRPRATTLPRPGEAWNAAPPTARHDRYAPPLQRASVALGLIFAAPDASPHPVEQAAGHPPYEKDRASTSNEGDQPRKRRRSND